MELGGFRRVCVLMHAARFRFSLAGLGRPAFLSLSQGSRGAGVLVAIQQSTARGYRGKAVALDERWKMEWEREEGREKREEEDDSTGDSLVFLTRTGTTKPPISSLSRVCTVRSSAGVRKHLCLCCAGGDPLQLGQIRWR